MIFNLLGQGDIMVTRRVKGKEKRINIRPYIAGLSRSNGILHLQTRAVEGRTARVGEILSALFDLDVTDVRSFPIHRKRQLIMQNDSTFSPMEVR
jgi:hypothetical protein